MNVGVKGITLKGDKFYVRAWNGQKNVYIGNYCTLDKAKQAYDEWPLHPVKKQRQHVKKDKAPVTHKEERSSPEIYAIVEQVFKRLIGK
jgi:hypothetical protein